MNTRNVRILAFAGSSRAGSCREEVIEIHSEKQKGSAHLREQMPRSPVPAGAGAY